MAETGHKANPKQFVGIGLLGVATILCIVAMFTGWWGWEAGTISDSAKPYGNFDLGSPEAMDTPVLLTGLFFTVALLCVIGYLLTHVLPMANINLPPMMKTVCTWGAIGFGLVAVVYTFFMWPAALNENVPEGADKVSFFGSQGEGAGEISYGAGFGWYAAIIGAVVLPLVAYFMSRTTTPAGWSQPGTTNPGAPRTNAPAATATRPPPPRTR